MKVQDRDNEQYIINCLHYYYNGYYYFQSTGEKAIKNSDIQFVSKLKSIELLPCRINELLIELDYSEASFDDLVDRNIIIPKRIYKETVLRIIDDFIDNLENNSGHCSINSIFVYSEKIGFRCVNIIKAAIVLGRKVEITRYDTTGMNIFVDRIFVCDTNSENIYKENPVSINITKSKSLSNFILQSHGINVPKQELVNMKCIEKIKSFIETNGYPVCLKPDMLTESIDVFCNIQNTDELQIALEYLSTRYKYIVIEKSVPGNLYRLYYCGGEMIGITQKLKKYIIGDGVRNIDDLIRQKYKNTAMETVTKENQLVLKRNGLTPETVVDINEKVIISDVATDSDFQVYSTEFGHNKFQQLLEHIASIMKMNFFAIDLIAESICIDCIPCVIEIQESPEFGRNNPLADDFYLAYVKYMMQKYDQISI